MVKSEATMERISVPAEVKNALFGMRLPGEKVGDVIARLVRDARHDAFIRHLDERPAIRQGSRQHPVAGTRHA